MNSKSNAKPAAVPAEAVREFRTQGCTVLRDYFVPDDLESVRRDIGELVKIQLRHSGAMVDEARYDWLGEGINTLARMDRGRVGAVYDAGMKLCSTRALAVSRRAMRLATTLLGQRLLSISNNIIFRMDLPREDHFLFPWHQDYPYAMVSERGCVFWIPIAPITVEMGPVQVLKGSHANGVRKVRRDGRGYFELAGQPPEDSSGIFSVPVDVGDVVVFDILSAHRSQKNRSHTPRLTMSFRYCDMADPASAERGWPSYYRQGRPFEEVHPDYIL